MSLFNWRKKKKQNNDFVDLKNSFADRPAKLSNPYVIKIENTSSEVKEWVLFGSNLHLLAINSGNDLQVKVENLGTTTPYNALLVEHIAQRTKIGKMRFQSTVHSNLHKHNFKIVRQLLSSGWFQESVTIKDIPLAIMMDAYQQQADILDFTVEFDIDRYTHITGVIEPNSVIVVSMFPIEIEQEQFKTTRLSGKNVPPVIISVTDNNPTKGKITTFWDLCKNYFKSKSKKQNSPSSIKNQENEKPHFK